MEVSQQTDGTRSSLYISSVTNVEVLLRLDVSRPAEHNCTEITQLLWTYLDR